LLVFVANEVKDLAHEAGRATGDIAERVQAIQTDATDAVRAISEISDVIGRINDSQTTIASAVEEKTATTHEMNRNVVDAATGSGEIAANIGSVAAASQVTSEGVQQLHGAVGHLSAMSADLQALVAQFRY
jgi:methyl-accepting chemotaxis protein